MKVYAVIDTNVIISSMLTRNPDSSTIKIMTYVRDGIIVPMVNHDILEEYLDVMSRSKFRFSSESVDDMLKLFRVRGINAAPECMTLDFTDPNDVIFYQTYRMRQEAYLITGNQRHFPCELRIVSPTDMVNILTLMNEVHGGVLTESAVEYMSDERRTQLLSAWNAYENLRASVVANGISEMSMEEIDEEIRQSRAAKSAKNS